jgi:hypothetical protein
MTLIAKLTKTIPVFITVYQFFNNIDTNFIHSNAQIGDKIAPTDALSLI